MYKVGDSVFYIFGDKYYDKLYIASVQKGEIKEILVNGKYLIGGSIYGPEHCTQDKDEAFTILIEVMNKKTEYLKDKIEEFRKYKEELFQARTKYLIQSSQNKVLTEKIGK